jgi:hypothetical protein
LEAVDGGAAASEAGNVSDRKRGGVKKASRPAQVMHRQRGHTRVDERLACSTSSYAWAPATSKAKPINVDRQ